MQIGWQIARDVDRCRPRVNDNHIVLRHQRSRKCTDRSFFRIPAFLLQRKAVLLVRFDKRMRGIVDHYAIDIFDHLILLKQLHIPAYRHF